MTASPPSAGKFLRNAAVGSLVYIDLGANKGDTVADYLRVNPEARVHAFEPNPKFIEALRSRFRGQPVVIHQTACWIADGEKPLFLGHDLSSTLMTGKKVSPRNQRFNVDYQSSIMVKTIDFARWVRENFSSTDTIVVKMDIEGAEYAVLQHLLDTGSIRLISELYCEWHQDRFPISAQEDARIRKAVREHTRVVRWV